MDGQMPCVRGVEHHGGRDGGNGEEAGVAVDKRAGGSSETDAVI